MQAKRKVLLAFLTLQLVLAAILVAGIAYVYQHPELLRHSVEKALSHKTGLTATIGSLSFSRKPWRVQAHNIALTPEGDTPGGQARIGTLAARLAFSGPLGRRKLSIERLKVAGVSLAIPPGARLPAALSAPPASPSLPARLLARLTALLLFREIRLMALEVQDGQLTVDTGTHLVQLQGIQGGFDVENGLEIVCSLDARWAAREAHVRIPRLRLYEAAPAEGRSPLSAIRLEARGVILQSPEADISAMDLLADLRHDLAHRRIRVAAAQIRCRRISLKRQGGRSVPLPELILALSGAVDLATQTVEISDWRLSAEDLLALTGTAQANLGTPGVVRIAVQQGSVRPGGVTPLLAGVQTPAKGVFQIDGSLQVWGTLEGREAAGAWGWHCNLETLFDENRFTSRHDPWHLSGRLSGTIAVRGPIPAVAFSGHLRSPRTEVSGPQITLDPFQTEVTLSGSYPALRIDRLLADIPTAILRSGSEPFQVADIGVDLKKGQVDLVTGKVFFPDIQVSSTLLRNLHLALERAGSHNSVRLRGKGIRLMGNAQSPGIVPPGWQVEADDALWVELDWQDGGSGKFQSRIDFQKLGFQDTPGRFMGENIQFQVRSQGRFGLKNLQVEAEISLKAVQGEVLVDRFYLNLGRNPLEAKIQGDYQALRRRLKVSSLTLTLGDMARAALQGEAVLTAGGFQSRLTVKLPSTPIEPLFQHFIREPFKLEKPFLDDIHLGGDVSAELDGAYTSSGSSLKGHVSWRHGELARQGAPAVFTGVNLDFPVWVAAGGPGTAAEALPGRLRVDAMRLPLLPEQPLDLQLAGLPGGLAVTTAFTINLPTGFLRVDPVQVRNLYGPSIEAETAVRVNGVDLPALLGSLGHGRILPGFTQGRLDGKIDPLRLAGNVLTGQGEITADMLGGQMRISNPGITGLFTTTPVYRGDVRLASINLAALTAQTAFGRIDGILNGHIQGLEIAHGQPQRFDLLLETVEHKDTPQRISVRAVDNIAQLGGGQSPFLGLAGGMIRLFKNFPYRKIGVHSVLENDVFRINGTIHERGREYLMKRGGFSGVDVVNLNPDNRISFRDMLKRIKRIGSSEGGPVVR